MRSSTRMTTAEAEDVAIRGLAFLAGDPEALGRFLALTGIGPRDLRSAAAEPGFLAGVIEFFMADEPLLLAFSLHAGIRPTMLAAARHALAGAAGEDV